jgi:hypothetical protein
LKGEKDKTENKGRKLKIIKIMSDINEKSGK